MDAGQKYKAHRKDRYKRLATHTRNHPLFYGLPAIKLANEN